MNRSVRAAAVAAGVPLWKVATELEIAETTLYRWLRAELSENRKTAIMAAIEKLSEEAET